MPERGGGPVPGRRDAPGRDADLGALVRESEEARAGWEPGPPAGLGGFSRTGAEKWREDPMRMTLQLAVPLWLDERRGWPPEILQRRARECSAVVAEHGDVLMFKGKKAENAGHAFNHLADGMACALLVADGGMEFLGAYWDLDEGGSLRVGPVTT